MLFFNNEMELIVCSIYTSICSKAFSERQECLKYKHLDRIIDLSIGFYGEKFFQTVILDPFENGLYFCDTN